MHGRIEYPKLNRLASLSVRAVRRGNDNNFVGLMYQIHSDYSQRMKASMPRKASMASSNRVCMVVGSIMLVVVKG
jgi:hypothetical protein